MSAVKCECVSGAFSPSPDGRGWPQRKHASFDAKTRSPHCVHTQSPGRPPPAAFRLRVAASTAFTPSVCPSVMIAGQSTPSRAKL